MRYFVEVGGRTVEVDLSDGTPRVDGRAVRAEIVSVPGTQVRHLVVDGRSYPITAVPGERSGRWHLGLGASRLVVDAVDERTRALREMTGGAADAAEKVITAPMPGLVVKVEVEPGQRVEAGQGVVIVEAMKMENELKAPAAGVVAEIRAQAGQTVEKGAVLLVLE